MSVEGWSDEAILREMGERLRTERLNRNLTVDEVATRAGVSPVTMYKVESGANHSLKTLLRILRALNLLNRVDALLPDVGVSPIQLAALRGKQRQRASGSRGRRSGSQLDRSWSNE